MWFKWLDRLKPALERVNAYEGINESAIKTWLNMKTYREGFTPFVEGFADLDANIKSSFEGKFGK